MPLPPRVRPQTDQGTAPRSALEHIIARGLPAVNEVLFLGDTSTLTRVAVMRVQMGCAIGNGVFQRHVPLKPLMQIPGLSDVDRKPAAVRQLFGINENAGQCLEGRVQRINLELILLAGLSKPVAG